MAVSQQALVDAVRGIQVPGLQGSVLELRMISELDVTPGAVRVVLHRALHSLSRALRNDQP